jgi:hypothetical protein
MQDYTKLAVGTKIAGKEIKNCPHCGRNGLFETTDGKDWYVHAEGVDANASEATTGWTMCPKIPLES